MLEFVVGRFVILAVSKQKCPRCSLVFIDVLVAE